MRTIARTDRNTTYTIRCGRTVVGVYFSRQRLNKSLAQFSGRIGLTVEVSPTPIAVSNNDDRPEVLRLAA